MAYDEGLAERIRSVLRERDDVVEKKMFGGLCFMVRGHMTVGINGDELMVRVGKDAHNEMMALPGATTFDKSARPMRGWLNVTPEGFAPEDDFKAWIGRGVSFAESLPKK